MVIGAGAGAGIAYASRQTRTSSVGLTASATGHKLTTAQIAAKVDPAVVDVETNLGEGTGMVVTSTGEIITNNHVIEDASTIKVVIDHRGTYKATVVGTDATADVAVLKLSGVSGLKTVKFASSSTVKIGDTVVAIGNAGGQGFPSTVTAGAVTALDRTITAVDEVGATERLKDMIQTDAVLVAGNSGGPLVDSSGGVIGMDTAAGRTEGGSSTGYALPVNQVLKIANEMEAGKSGNGIVIGSQAFLGIAGETVSSSSGSTVSGIGIEYVESGSPAALAGIEMGDVIVAFDGHATATIGELSTLIHKLRPGDRAAVTFENSSGSTETVTVTLTTAPPA
jgi:S1-C subfamily serine protease